MFFRGANYNVTPELTEIEAIVTAEQEGEGDTIFNKISSGARGIPESLCMLSSVSD